MRRVLFPSAAAIIFLSGCAGYFESIAELGPQPYHIGPLVVQLVSENEAARRCDGFTPSGPSKVLGCYLPKEIIATADVRVLVLLFKDYFKDAQKAQIVTEADAVLLGEDPYKVGPFEVWVRGESEVNLFCHVFSGIPATHISYGCYLYRPDNLGSKIILIIDEPLIFLHEVKHYFEGKWHKQ